MSKMMPLVEYCNTCNEFILRNSDKCKKHARISLKDYCSSGNLQKLEKQFDLPEILKNLAEGIKDAMHKLQEMETEVSKLANEYKSKVQEINIAQLIKNIFTGSCIKEQDLKSQLFCINYVISGFPHQRKELIDKIQQTSEIFFKKFLDDFLQFNLRIIPNPDKKIPLNNFSTKSNEATNSIPREVYTPKEEEKAAIRIIKKPCGIYNTGLSCHLNSVLQCLIACPPFTYHFLKEAPSKTKIINELRENLKDFSKNILIRTQIPHFLESIKTGYKMSTMSDAFQTYTQFITELAKHDSTTKDLLMSHCFISNECAKCKRKTWNQISYYGLLLNNEMDYDKYSAKGEINARQETEKIYIKGINVEFEYTSIKSTFSCNSLMSCLDSLLTDADIRDYECRACGFKKGNTRIFIRMAPKILVLHINKEDSYSSSRRYLIEETIDIKNYMIFPKRESFTQNTLYNLVGRINYSGNYHSGHYTAIVKYGTKVYHVSDLSVIESSLYSMTYAYDVPFMLFYMRSDSQFIFVI